MRTTLRVAALFAVYATIGYGGDWIVGLLADESEPVEAGAEVEVAVEPQIVVEPEVVVDVRPTIVSRVQVRHAGACEYTLDRELTAPIDAAASVEIRTAAGELHVEGREGLEEAVIVGMLCASHEAYLDDLDVSVERSSAGDLTIVAHYPSESRREWSGRDNTARIDLTVLIPLGVDVEILDSSGDIVASGTGDLRIDDSSGSIEVTEVHGALWIDDSSSEISVIGVTGDVEIDDGSGSLDVTDVGGSVTLRDGSGSMELAGIAGDVIVESDGSGSIEVRDVGGDFVVERDGNGGIRHRGVQGRVEIPQRRRRGR